MGIHTDWYIHDLAILARVTDTASAEDVALMDFELRQLLNSATRPTIILLHFDQQQKSKTPLITTERLKSLNHAWVKSLVCCGRIEAALARICRAPRKFGFDFDGKLFDQWADAVAHILDSCDKLTQLDIENADDLFNLNHGDIL